MDTRKQRLAEQFRSIIIRANDGMKLVNKKGVQEVNPDDVYDVINDIESDLNLASKITEEFIS